MTQTEKINWMEWGKDAFERAKKENRPILLDISAVWCHWCHELDKNAYSDPVVIKTINENFVPIRVDTDKRPDINERYNQGGWPTTAFLTPEGGLIAGATYVPVEQMKALLPQVKYFYNTQKQNISSTIQKPQYKEGVVSEQIAQDVALYLKDNFDAVHGGFYYEPKFPMPEAIEIAILLYIKTHDKELLNIVKTTLDRMTGIYDTVENGFFRYSVRQDWSLPHYEKMLEVNAGLLQNYVHAFSLTGKEDYRKIAEGIIKYIRPKLFGIAFYGSQDADEEYYALPLAERKQAKEPFIDKTIYTNWNGKCIAAFVDAYAVLGDATLLTDAQKVLNFLIDSCYNEKQGMCHYHDGKKNVFGLLTDNVWMMAALLKMYQATAERTYLETAEKIADYIIKNLKDKKGFFDRIKEKEGLGLLKERNKSILENSIAAMVFTELTKLTGKEEYIKVAEGCLSIFSQDYKAYGIHAALYALAVEKFLDNIHVVVVGDAKDEEETRKLAAISDPRIIVQFLDEKQDEKDVKKLGYGRGVFVCHGSTCNKFNTIEEAMRKLSGFE